MSVGHHPLFRLALWTTRTLARTWSSGGIGRSNNGGWRGSWRALASCRGRRRRERRRAGAEEAVAEGEAAGLEEGAIGEGGGGGAESVREEMSRGEGNDGGVKEEGVGSAVGGGGGAKDGGVGEKEGAKGGAVEDEDLVIAEEVHVHRGDVDDCAEETQFSNVAVGGERHTKGKTLIQTIPSQVRQQ
ncbi:hypothetical protein QJS10_CPA10g00445 [Acorus calamus]|uniref:Uncharacterized protein n=1 Tax=Acorus calamus TaxID=4465 RepID=A0AAV9E222_ACOCL|nr:hypothetical protein QJS10_CPA10g00445 [Acorus calamus]